jgi:hypothetical protein
MQGLDLKIEGLWTVGSILEEDRGLNRRKKGSIREFF